MLEQRAAAREGRFADAALFGWCTALWCSRRRGRFRASSSRRHWFAHRRAAHFAFCALMRARSSNSARSGRQKTESKTLAVPPRRAQSDSRLFERSVLCLSEVLRCKNACVAPSRKQSSLCSIHCTFASLRRRGSTRRETSFRASPQRRSRTAAQRFTAALAETATRRNAP